MSRETDARMVVDQLLRDAGWGGVLDVDTDINKMLTTH